MTPVTDVNRAAATIQWQEEKAATLLQSVIRSHFAKLSAASERKYPLSSAMIEGAKEYIDAPSKLIHLPHPPHGKTAVYFPPNSSVIKAVGPGKSTTRVKASQQARAICEQMGTTSLAIPSSRVYNNYVIESRLPVFTGTKYQIGLYLEFGDLFTQAITEFAEFACRVDLGDLAIPNRTDLYSELSETPLGRHDNFPLFYELENGELKGKLGLVDLGEFEPSAEKWSENWCFLRCCGLVRLFPNHLDTILKTAIKYDPDIENYREELEKERAGTLKRFKRAYEDHLVFLQEKGITLDCPTKLGEIDPSIRKILINKIDAVVSAKLCVLDCPIPTILKENFPTILDLTMQFLSDTLTKKIPEGPIGGYSYLLFYRTIVLDELDNDYLRLQRDIKLKLGAINIDSQQKGYLAHSLTTALFQELANQRIIAYYNPNLGPKEISSSRQCIFC